MVKRERERERERENTGGKLVDPQGWTQSKVDEPLDALGCPSLLRHTHIHTHAHITTRAHVHG